MLFVRVTNTTYILLKTVPPCVISHVSTDPQAVQREIRVSSPYAGSVGRTPGASGMMSGRGRAHRTISEVFGLLTTKISECLLRFRSGWIWIRNAKNDPSQQSKNNGGGNPCARVHPSFFDFFICFLQQ